MSIEIIQPRKRVTQTEHRLEYWFADDPTAGFSFECDAEGNILDEPKYIDAAKENLEKCRTGAVDGRKVICRGVQTYSWNYWEPAIGRCLCGEEIFLDLFTNTCQYCERDYNSSGQLLAPRSQWGEETGEHWSDCY